MAKYTSDITTGSIDYNDTAVDQIMNDHKS